jgi:putative transposase
MDQYVSIRIATQITGIQAQTLRKMADRKEIRCFKTPSGQRKFNSQDLQNMLNNYTDKSLPVETEKKITYILGSLLKNKWMIFLDKLNSLDLAVMNILPTFLLRTLLQELTLKEKAFKPFWTPACKEISAKLLSPIEIDYPDSDLISSRSLLKKVVEKSQLLTVKQINLQNKNLQKTSFQLSTFSAVAKWEKEATKEVIKSLKIPLKMKANKRIIIDEWMETSNRVYNKALYEIKVNKTKIDFETLRNKIVTDYTYTNSDLYKEKKQLQKEKYALEKENKNTDFIDQEIKKKQEELKNFVKTKNPFIEEGDLNTPKNIRSGAIDDVVKAYKTGFSNLKAGNIRYVNIEERKETKCIVIEKKMIKNKDGVIQIAKNILKENSLFKMGRRNKRKYKDLEINCDCRIIKQHNDYYLIVPIKEKVLLPKTANIVCGIDPGIRTFMTTFGNNGCYEYEHDRTVIDKLNEKKKILLKRTTKEGQKFRKQIKKKALLKIEKKISNLVDEIHWKTITDIVKKNDVIYYGDIKSHNIVKSKNCNLNRDTNGLKFFQFKQRLEYKAKQRNKLLILVQEQYTTKTCSNCGVLNEVGIRKTYTCTKCNVKYGRDLNAAKNILIKGLISS